MKTMLQLVHKLTALDRFELVIDNGDNIRLLDTLTGVSVSIHHDGDGVLSVIIPESIHSSNYRTNNVDAIVKGILEDLVSYEHMSRIEILADCISNHFGESIEVYSEFQPVEDLPIGNPTVVEEVATRDEVVEPTTVNMDGGAFVSSVSTHSDDGMTIEDLNNEVTDESVTPPEETVPTQGDNETGVQEDLPIGNPTVEDVVEDTLTVNGEQQVEQPTEETPVVEPVAQEPTEEIPTVPDVPAEEEFNTEIAYDIILKADFSLLVGRHNKHIDVKLRSIIGNYIEYTLDFNGTVQTCRFPYNHSIFATFNIFRENVQALVAVR